MTICPRRLCVAFTLLLVASLWSCASARAQHFKRCISSTLNATVIVPREVNVKLAKGRPLEPGDEIALFTNDGQCVGWSRWQQTSFAITVASAGPYGSTGYQSGARLRYRIWDASEEEVLNVKAAYRSCRSGMLCRSDGRYKRNAVYLLSSLTPRSPSSDEAAYSLSPFSPNPFRARTQFTLRLQHGQNVTIVLYSVLGQRLRVLYEGPVEAERTYTFTIEGNGLPSGTYFCRVQGETFAATRRAVLVK